MKVALVWRSGGEYKLEHVARLVRQIREPGCWTGEILVLSDLPVDLPGVTRVPLEFAYPGWWSKMELFKLGLDLTCFDLDTTIVGSIAGIAAVKGFAPIADFYRPHKLQTSMGVFDAAGCRATWIEWLRLTPPAVMAGWRGDGEFIDSVWRGKAAPLQDLAPGQIVSYKVHVQLDPKKAKHIGNGFIPPGARVVCYHGVPRPWAISEPRFK